MIKIYNTLTRTKEDFKPIKDGEVRMYACGPTVYDVPHIGNYRTFVMTDILRRVFEYNSYNVEHVMNVTDVDDKTIKKSQSEGVSLKEITQKYEKLFLDGLASLNILPPTKLIRATESIDDMIRMIQTLIDKGCAYVAHDGVYMSITKVKDYGQLAQIKLDDKSTERITNDEYDKESPRDFALWKFKSESDGEVSWKAPFGEGRPGWHIECSAMAVSSLGSNIDIHTGGSDLIFPHHTNEIAQSECATGEKFANYWVHGGFMTMKTEKMSKSKGLIVSLNDLTEEALSPLAYRYWLLTSHYRSQIDFSTEALKAAQTALIRFISVVRNFPDGGNVIPAYKQKFTTYINDDMEMPKAVALAWDLVKDTNHSEADKKATILDFDKVFGLNLAELKYEEEKIPDEIIALAEAREEARKSKDWTKSDALRKEINERGYEIKDRDKGYQISSLD